MKIIFFLLGLALVNTLDPGAKIAVNTSIYERLVNLIVPSIDKKLENVTLDNYTKKIPLFEVNFTNNHLYMAKIETSQISIMFKNKSSKTNVKVFGMEGNATINVDYDMAGIKDHIRCDAFLKYMHIDSTISNEVNKSGDPIVKASATLHLDPLKAELVFTGGFTAKVLELLEPIIKVFLLEAVDISINSNLRKWIDDEINGLLNSFKVDMKINDDIYVNYELPTVSTYYDDYLSVPLSGYLYYKGKKYPPTFAPYHIPDLDLTLNYQLQYYLGDYMLNSGLKATYDNNLLIYNFSYDIINPFDMHLFCKASKTPVAIFGNSFNANLSFYCNVTAFNRTDQSTTLFNTTGDLSFILGYYFNNKAIQFTIQKVQITDLKFEKPSDFDITWFINGSQEIADFVANYIDYVYLANGIPLPNIDHISYTRLNSRLSNHILEIYTNFSII